MTTVLADIAHVPRHRSVNLVAAIAPANCATMNPGASAGRMPAKCIGRGACQRDGGIGK
jgi:hypothetical protein